MELPINKIISKLLRRKFIPTKEQFVLINRSPKAIYYYATMINSLYEKGEKVLAKSANYSLLYLNRFDKELKKYPKRLELLENAIAKNANCSYEYASYTGKRFKKGEDAIAKDIECSYQYAKYVLKGRFEKGESLIAKDPNISCDYATEIIKGRFEKGEETISKDSNCSINYAALALKSRFPKGEKIIKKDGNWGYYQEDIALSLVNEAIKNKKRILDKEMENYVIENNYASYKKLLKTLITNKISDGQKIIEEYGDLSWFDDIILSISKNEIIPEEINNYMIAKGLINNKISKQYLENQKSIKNKIKNFLKKHSGKTVDSLILCM